MARLIDAGRPACVAGVTIRRVDLREEFELARRHAGVDAARVRLWLVNSDPFEDGPPAVTVQPGWTVEDDNPLFDATAQREANEAVLAEIHRVAVRTGIVDGDHVAAAAVAGLMRHELEHVKQFDGEQGRARYDLDWLADRIAAELDGPTGVAFYRTKPAEASANAAAAAFLAERHPQARAALAGTRFAPFATTGTIIRGEDLPRLTVDWIRHHAPRIYPDELFDDGLTWTERLDDAMEGASAWWETPGDEARAQGLERR
jgi:hypothetical protein